MKGGDGGGKKECRRYDGTMAICKVVRRRDKGRNRRETQDKGITGEKRTEVANPKGKMGGENGPRIRRGKKQSEVKERQGRWTVKRQSRGIRGS